MAQRKNYIGQTSGRLTVIGEAYDNGKRINTVNVFEGKLKL